MSGSNVRSSQQLINMKSQLSDYNNPYDKNTTTRNKPNANDSMQRNYSFPEIKNRSSNQQVRDTPLKKNPISSYENG